MRRTVTVEVQRCDVEVDLEIEAVRHRAQPPCYQGPNEGFPGQPESVEIQGSVLVGVYVHIGRHICPVEVPESARTSIVEHLTQVHARQIVDQLAQALEAPFEERA